MAKEYIEREAAKRELLSWAVSLNHPEYLIKDDALHIIDSIPAADVVEQEQESKLLNEWISVKDRLPDICGFPCLLCGENAFGQIRVFAGFTGYMERGKFKWHSNQKDIDIDVWTITRWMPLPNTPKGE